jgi:hypothetical protein
MKAIQTLQQFLPTIAAETYQKILGKLLQQGAEKILVVRAEAGRTLIILRENPRNDVQECEELDKIVFWPKLSSNPHFKTVEQRTAEENMKQTMADHIVFGKRELQDPRLPENVWISNWGLEKQFKFYKNILKLGKLCLPF